MLTTSQIQSITAHYHGRGREALLPLLWDVQKAYGQIDAQAVHEISHTLRVPEADIYGVIQFYSLLYDQPTGDTIIRVCGDPSCGLAGGGAVLAELAQQLGISEGEITADGTVQIERAPCLGLCDHAPAALVSERGKGEHSAVRVTAAGLLAGTARQGYESHIHAEPANLLKPRTPYAALRHALTMLPDDVIQAVIDSALIGRGGAAFPTGMKWKYTRQTKESVKYLVCNADESEPGTFKDRVLLEQYPHLLLEGVAIAAHAVGATRAYIFIRGEYPHAQYVLHHALLEAEADAVPFPCPIEIRRGAGAYICGEETALFEAIEGKRGFPRIKPPFPTTHGLFGKPTAVNNVETLCAVVSIIEHGAEWFKALGTERSTGSKLVSVSGHVQRPGVYEIEPGITLRHLLEERCGIAGELQAVLMGGAAGTFLTPDEIDVPLTFEDLRAANSTFGSGAIMVFNTSADLRDTLKRLAVFFKHESCGKCFPCQLGTQRQHEILERLENPLEGDRQRLQDVGITMTEASLCGLGQTAASAILSAMTKFPHLFG